MPTPSSQDCHQLRYYIAPGAPPTREQADGSEPFLRPVVGFTPQWYRHYCGLDFGERWHRDPDVRLQGWERMCAELRRRFPGRNIGGCESDAPPDLLTGTYGGCVVSAIYGQGIQFWEHNWPATAPGGELSDAQADALEPPDLDANPFFADILRQMDRIEQLTGTIRGFLNWQGVLNTAFRLRGHQIFLDLTDAPARARRIFHCVTETMRESYRRVHARQRAAGLDYQFGTTANCVVNMVSPKHYEEFLLPFDLTLRRAFKHFGVHNCAWSVTPYLEAYARIPDLGYLDMGLASDLPAAKRLFPHARRNLLYTAMDLMNKSEAQIRADFERIARELGPCDLGLPNMELGVTDERIRFALDLCDELSARCAAAGPSSPARPASQRPRRRANASVPNGAPETPARRRPAS